MPFENREWGKFKTEIDEANKKASEESYDSDVAPGPFCAVAYKVNGNWQWAASDGFRRMVQSQRKFKWTLNERGDLGVISPTLKHSVAAGGGDVLTAGHGHYDSAKAVLTLDNDTGHYHTTEESLKQSRTAWEYLGYNVAYKARVDYTKLFA
jgi:hypothetical protein